MSDTYYALPQDVLDVVAPKVACENPRMGANKCHGGQCMTPWIHPYPTKPTLSKPVIFTSEVVLRSVPGTRIAASGIDGQFIKLR